MGAWRLKLAFWGVWILWLTKGCVWGASTVRYTGKVLRYTKTIHFWVKCLKIGETCFLYWNFFMVPFIVVLGTQI